MFLQSPALWELQAALLHILYGTEHKKFVKLLTALTV